MCLKNKTVRFKDFPVFTAWKVICKREEVWRSGVFTYVLALSTWQEAEDLQVECGYKVTKERDLDGDYGFCVFETEYGAREVYPSFHWDTKVVKVKCRGNVVLGTCDDQPAAYVSQIKFGKLA